MNGKGSKQRPTNKVAFDTNFDNIFGKKDNKSKNTDKPTGNKNERSKIVSKG